MHRLRSFFMLTALVLLAPAFFGGCTSSEAGLPTVTVYKSPTCGCCGKWTEHLRKNGFPVKTVEMPDVSPMKTRFGVPARLGSCHTAVVGGYVVEGHVPADVIRRMLSEKPDVTGLAVPGMPIGSPGMEGARPQSYDVVAFDRKGRQTVYAKR
ncbi:DUF411 domain-containing protein [Rhodocaloribacter sp.]